MSAAGHGWKMKFSRSLFWTGCKNVTPSYHFMKLYHWSLSLLGGWNTKQQAPTCPGVLESLVGLNRFGTLVPCTQCVGVPIVSWLEFVMPDYWPNTSSYETILHTSDIVEPERLIGRIFREQLFKLRRQRTHYPWRCTSLRLSIHHNLSRCPPRQCSLYLAEKVWGQICLSQKSSDTCLALI